MNDKTIIDNIPVRKWPTIMAYQMIAHLYLLWGSNVCITYKDLHDDMPWPNEQVESSNSLILGFHD